VLRTLPKKGESLTTVCAAEAEPTYEKTGAGALVDMALLPRFRTPLGLFLPEVHVAVFFAWEDLSWRWVGRSNRHLAPESVFFTMKEKTFFFFSSRRLTCNMAGSRTPVLSFAIQAI
jgi:hypothetical protein